MSYVGDDSKEFSGTIFTKFPFKKKKLRDSKKEKKIGEYSVTLIGIGWIGSFVLESLLQAGLRKITIIDNMKVTKDDINLGAYYGKDIGNKRYEALTNKPNILTHQNNLKWISEELTLISPDTITRNSDLVILCTDSPSISSHNYVNNICLNNDIKWLSSRLCHTRGEIGPTVMPYKTACYKCYEYRLASCKEARIVPREIKEPNQHIASSNMLTRIIAGYTAHEALCVVTSSNQSSTLGAVLHIHPMNYIVSLHRVFRIPNCPTCGSR